MFLEELLLDLININDSQLIELFNYDIITLLQYDLNILYNSYQTFDNIESLYAFFDNDKTIIKKGSNNNNNILYTTTTNTNQPTAAP